MTRDQLDLIGNSRHYNLGSWIYRVYLRNASLGLNIICILFTFYINLIFLLLNFFINFFYLILVYLVGCLFRRNTS